MGATGKALGEWNTQKVYGSGQVDSYSERCVEVKVVIVWFEAIYQKSVAYSTNFG